MSFNFHGWQVYKDARAFILDKKKLFDAKPLKSGAGFTLIEIIVVVFGFSLIIWGLIGLYSGIFTLSNQQSGLLSDADQARNLAFQIAFELRNGQTGSNGAYVLDTAASQQIIFYANIDATPAVERVRYFVQNSQLWKGITQYNGSTYNTSTETTYIVQKDLANSSSTPVFYYYDGSYTGSSTQSSLAQPVNQVQVKFIKVNLQIYDKAGVKNTNTYTVTASAAIRNLKTNLGQ
jgi:Tfp pilus assembly protein PilV